MVRFKVLLVLLALRAYRVLLARRVTRARRDLKVIPAVLVPKALKAFKGHRVRLAQHRPFPAHPAQRVLRVQLARLAQLVSSPCISKRLNLSVQSLALSGSPTIRRR